jgi:hypothetical protein
MNRVELSVLVNNNIQLERTRKRCPVVKNPAKFPFLNTQEDKRRKEERDGTVN